MKRPTCLILVGALASLPLLACGDDGDDHHHDHPDAAVDGPDAETAQAVTLSFSAVVGGAAFACSEASAAKTYDGLGTGSSTAGFKDFRFYVSNVRLLSGTTEVRVVLDTDGKWQLQSGDDHVALLDFEDGSGLCAGTGNADLNTEVKGTVPVGTYDGVVFEIGVPFALNHLDVTTADPPLNIGAMYWAWASGHKFARIDYDVGGTPWNMHLGSTMCSSDGMTDPPGSECGRPNRATVRLTGFDPAADTITFDAAALVADSDISTNLGDATPGCMSFPHDEPDCTALFSNLGLDYTSGACADGCANQSVVTAE